jgi:hypothetical protein
VVARRLAINRASPVTEWVLHATGPKSDLPGGVQACWIWSESGRELASGDAFRTFTTGTEGRTITLALKAETRDLATYTRSVPTYQRDPLEDDDIRFRLEFVSTPNFVYPHEPFEINAVVVNESDEAVELELVERTFNRAGDLVVEKRPEPFTLPAFTFASDKIARRMNRITRRFEPGAAEDIARLTFGVGPPGAVTDELELVVIQSRADKLSTLRPRLGALEVDHGQTTRSVYAASPRAMIVMPYDTAADLRRWAFVKNLSETTARGTEGTLFFGDPLSSPGARGGEGLATRMAAAFVEDGDSLTVHTVSGDDYPALEAVAAIDAELRKQAWESVYISLGGRDSRMGTPLVDYRRALDLMIDRVRSVASGARLIIIGPTPEVGRERTSEAYAEAARAVCKQHATTLVDLHDFILDREDPSLLYRERGPEDGTRFPYPVGQAIDEVAEFVLDH